MPPPPEARVAHHIPGRLRLIIPRLRQEPDLADSLSRELLEREDVLGVAVRPTIGSLVVRYLANGHDPETFLGTLKAVVRLEEVSRAGRPEPPPGASIGETAAIRTREQWTRLNRALRDSTEGALDLATLVPLFFVFLAVRQLLTQPALVPIPWYVALHYAVLTFDYSFGRAPRAAEIAVAVPGGGSVE